MTDSLEQQWKDWVAHNEKVGMKYSQELTMYKGLRLNLPSPKFIQDQYPFEDKSKSISEMTPTEYWERLNANHRHFATLK